MCTDLLTRIKELAGEEVASQIAQEFGGDQVYIRRAISPREMVRCADCTHHHTPSSVWSTVCTITQHRVGLNNPRLCDEYTPQEPTMTAQQAPQRLCADRLRILLRLHRYADLAVRSSAFGGWFMPRSSH